MTENIALYERCGFEEVAWRTEDSFRRVYVVKRLRYMPGIVGNSVVGLCLVVSRHDHETVYEPSSYEIARDAGGFSMRGATGGALLPPHCPSSPVRAMLPNVLWQGHVR